MLSFLVIGVMWANHHALFKYIRRAARALILSNLLLMMGVAFVPFPTAILAEHLTDPATRSAAAVFYGATLDLSFARLQRAEVDRVMAATPARR